MNPSLFETIVHDVINLSKTFPSTCVIPPICNSVYFLPTCVFSTTKATEFASILIKLLNDHSFHASNHISFQVAAAAVFHFIKKLLKLIKKPENLVIEFLLLLANEDLNYTDIYQLSQCVITIITTLFNNLKDIFDDVIQNNSTILDRCSPVQHLTFLRSIQQSLPLNSQFQLMASFLFSIKPDSSYPENSIMFFVYFIIPHFQMMMLGNLVFIIWFRQC